MRYLLIILFLVGILHGFVKATNSCYTAFSKCSSESTTVPPDTLGNFVDSLGNKHVFLRSDIIPDSLYDDSAKLPGVYTFVDTMPSFNKEKYGRLQSWIMHHLKYPNLGACYSGRVILRFVVRKDGRIDHVRILHSVDPYMDKEAVKVVNSMPLWNPGYKDGKPVDVYFVLPVSVRFQ